MKILTIRLKNLHSLRGEWHIPFTENPLRNAGIFAITGPTGAGKSTILDAITLALYGEISRQSENGEVMSHHTGECWAEVDFESNGRQYRARWGQTRARQKADGNLQNQEMMLAELPSEQIICNKIREVKSEVEQITGLDFTRFTQSVLLSQGEFARFLKANANERADLLERITGTQIYAELSKQCYEVTKSKLNEVKINQAKLKTGLLSDEEQAQLNAELTQLSAQSTQLKQVAAQLNTQLQWLQQIHQLQSSAEETTLKLNEAKQKSIELEPELSRLHRHEQALQFAGPLQEWKSKAENIQILEQRKKELTENNIVLANELRKITEDEKKLKSELQTAQTHLNKQQPLITQTIELDVELKQTQNQIADTELQLQEANKQFHELTNTLTALKETATRQQQELLKLNNFLDTNKQDETLHTNLPRLQDQINNLKPVKAKLTDLERRAITTQNELERLSLEETKLKTELEEVKLQAVEQETQHTLVAGELAKYPHPQNLQEEILRHETAGMNVKRQKQLSEEYVRKSGILDTQRQLYKELQQQNEKLQVTLNASKNLYCEAELHLATLEQQLNTKRLLASYEEDRQQLKAGEPCPLCGSTEHPYSIAEHTGQLKITETEAQIQLQKQKISSLSSENTQLEKEIAVCTQKMQQTETEGKNIKDELEKVINAEFNDLNQQLQTKYSISNPEFFEQILHNLRQQLLAAKKQAGDIIQLDQKRQQLKEQLSKTQTLLVQKEATLQQTGQNRVNAQKILAEVQTDIEAQQKLLTEKTAEINKLLAPYNMQLADSTQQIDQLTQQLQQRANLYQTRSAQKTTLLADITKADSSLENTNNLLAEKQKTITDINARLISLSAICNRLNIQRKTLTATFIEKDPHIEKQRLETILETARTAYQNINSLHILKGERLDQQKIQLHQCSEDLERENELFLFHSETLLEQIQPFGFATLQELDNSYIADLEEVKNIKKTEQQLKQQTEQLKGSLQSIHTTLEKTLQQQLTQKTAAELSAELQVNETQKQTTDQRVGQIGEKLAQDKILRAENAALQATLENLVKEYTRWKKLDTIIGSASGNEFKKFAQDITLQQLVGRANRHLHKLNDRYQIRKRPDKELDMEIIDMYQANVSRSVKTLSGGESFLVSLALALGLSDLAGRKTKIESLFIDEGFGTLDTATLDTAINTLENLQAQGKMIGVISHVELLKERITTQIQILKKSNGTSEVKIEAVNHSF